MRTVIRNWLPRAMAVAAAVLLAACGGGGGGGSAGNGTLQVSLTDAPACGFDHVSVTVSKVRAHQSSDPNVSDADAGWHDITLATPQKIDLLSLTNGALYTLGQTPLTAGHYQQLRLVLVPNSGSAPLANSVVPTGGSETAMSTPSGVQSGIKLIHQFDVAANTLVDLVLDFDACKSVVTKGKGNYALKPVVQVTPTVVSGVIEGWVDPTAVAAGPVTVSAQVYSGGTVTVAKTTVTDSTGKFVLSPVLVSAEQPAPYNVVVTAGSRATAVVTGVSVTAGATVDVNTVTSPILLDLSSMQTASGTVSGSAATNPSSGNIEVTVHAQQSLGSALVAEVASAGADASAGTYSLSLPVAAPKSAPYTSASTPLSFSTVPASAGLYTLKGVNWNGVLGSPSVGQPVDLSSSSQTVNFGF